jgi:hypothetical protein
VTDPAEVLLKKEGSSCTDGIALIIDPAGAFEERR